MAQPSRIACPLCSKEQTDWKHENRHIFDNHDQWVEENAVLRYHFHLGRTEMVVWMRLVASCIITVTDKKLISEALLIFSPK
jgi:hypothetical protein